MRSMTGFARVDASDSWGRLELELRSVNQRHLDLDFRLANGFQHLEPLLRQQLRERIQRGKVTLTLRLHGEQATTDIQLNQQRLEQLQAAMEQVEQQIIGIAQPTTLDVLGWPGVMQSGNQDQEALEAAALGLNEQGITALDEAREREGERLHQIIAERLAAMEHEVAEVKALLPGIVEHQRQQLQERARTAKLELDEHRLGAELALLVQRADVAEEIDRLESHITEIRHQLGKPGPIGRRLDFLIQELNREANTLASKSVVKETTHRAVELKVLIEQIREQVQNVE